MISTQTLFHTDRLTLRAPRLSDAEAIFHNYARDPEVTRYLVWRPHRAVTETEAFLRLCLEGWERQTELTWVLTLRDLDDAIGMVAVRPSDPSEHAVNFGYVLARKYWGQGMMTEAAGRLMEWISSTPGIYRIWATCDVENVASARVLEKLSMQREGVLRRWEVRPNISPEPRDSLVYAWVR